MLASSDATLTNEAKLRSFSEPPLSLTVTDCVAKAVRSGGGGGAILEGDGGSGGAAAAICTVSLNVTLLRCAVFVSIAVVGAEAPLASSVGVLSARGGLWGILRRWSRTARGRCAAPVSNGAPPLLGGPWASKLRPPSDARSRGGGSRRDLQVEEEC